MSVCVWDSVYKTPSNIKTQICDKIQCLQIWCFYFIQSDPQTQW